MGANDKGDLETAGGIRMTANEPGESPDIEDYLVRLKRKLRFMKKDGEIDWD